MEPNTQPALPRRRDNELDSPHSGAEVFRRRVCPGWMRCWPS